MNGNSSSRPLVSVVIPMFNHAPYIGICLESIFKSGYRPLEILILDDGSTDPSYETARAGCARHAHAGVRVRLMQQANQGLPKTLNQLVRLAEGEFIALIASDDYLLPEGLHQRVTALQQNPQWLAVFGDGIVVDENGRKTHDSVLSDFCRSNKSALLNPRLIARELILRWGIPGGALMIRRSAYHPVTGIGPYDETLPFEDRDFYLKGLARRAIGFIDVPVSAYRQHSSNFFKVKNSKRLARYFYGLYQCESRNAKLFGGRSRLALRILSRIAYDEYCRIEGKRNWPPGLRRLFWKLIGLIYFTHRLEASAATFMHRRMRSTAR